MMFNILKKQYFLSSQSAGPWLQRYTIKQYDNTEAHKTEHEVILVIPLHICSMCVCVTYNGTQTS